MKKQRLAMPFLILGGMLLSIANMYSQSITSAIEISYPLINNVQGGSILITNISTKESFSIIAPYSAVSIEAGEYLVEEVLAPEGYMPNINPSRVLEVKDGDNKVVKFYNSLTPGQSLPLYFDRRTNGGDFLVGADYTAMKLGEYYWMDNNFNHVEPSWQWWSTPVGVMSEYPIGQKQLDKYLGQVRLDRNYFQVDTTLFHKYYGRYYDHFTRHTMNYYAKMYEGVEKEETGWAMPYVRDFRQLFAMSPFSPENNRKSLGETDVRFALSAKKGDNPMTEYVIPGECGPTYWFDPDYVTNMYGFNMMPGGARYNEVAEGDSYTWSTNLCGDETTFSAYTGDLYHLFYTVKYIAWDGYASLHDIIDTGYGSTHHWYNMRWCRRMTDAELGYKLYIKADNGVMKSHEWAAFIEKGDEAKNDESGLLSKIRKGEFNAQSFDIVITEYSPNGDVSAPEGYEELPNGYIRGFYVQYMLSDRHVPQTSLRTTNSTITMSDVFIMASNVQDVALGAFSTTGVSDSDQLEDAIKVYPNPVADYLTVELEKGEIQAIRLFSIDGKLIETFMSSDRIYLGNLPQGVYMINIETSSGVFVKKILRD